MNASVQSKLGPFPHMHDEAHGASQRETAGGVRLLSYLSVYMCRAVFDSCSFSELTLLHAMLTHKRLPPSGSHWPDCTLSAIRKQETELKPPLRRRRVTQSVATRKAAPLLSSRTVPFPARRTDGLCARGLADTRTPLTVFTRLGCLPRIIAPRGVPFRRDYPQSLPKARFRE